VQPCTSGVAPAALHQRQPRLQQRHLMVMPGATTTTTGIQW
jgi:hypothetical protein